MVLGNYLLDKYLAHALVGSVKVHILYNGYRILLIEITSSLITGT